VIAGEKTCSTINGIKSMAFSIKDFSDIKKLGEGGMGNVYLATQVALDRKVVIKELSSNMLKDPKLIKRFENEAKSAAGLDHDNIIRVFDFGEDKHSFFISMEYIDGLDLEQLMRWQPFPREIGLMILLQAMKGLNYAHKQGIVHCDIKPGNILISKTGKVKVVDFGLAHASAQASDFIDPSSVFITPGYMPPEVASGGHRQDVFMDIWSTGVLAYRTICGTLPFASGDVRKLVYSIVHEKPKDIRIFVPTLPDDLINAVKACLEKVPQSRPSSLDQVIESLESYIYDLGVRDIEKMIMNYITNKGAAERAIADLLVQYHMQKGNEFLDAGNRVKSDAHFREAEKYGAIDQDKISKIPKTRFPVLDPPRIAPKRIISQQERPDFFIGAFFNNLLSAKRAVPVIGIISIIVLGALSVFMIVRKNQNSDPRFIAYSKPTAAPDDPSGQNHVQQKAPSAADTGNELLPGYAALKHELTSVDEIPKKSAGFSRPDKKKSGPSQAMNIRVRKPVFVPDKPSTGILKLTVEPADANILIDGKKTSAAELIEGKLVNTGNHAVVAYSNGYSSFSSILTIEPNATQFVSISLKQKEKGTGLLHVHSYPWAEIYIDGSLQGTAPTPKPLSLIEGDHTLVLKREGFKPYSETVHVVQGELTRIKVQLNSD
jgi:tRNA A-37 threonylcarbamoyl transferase component Bud32